ncbi:MAG TPA: type II toxin-antitoxin system CcdA family antitoxin [Gammaproteobacteria bacterium]|nr:type II toxin-antitoxin system CcdA family antitoxin [Gammaproteobacteria bacterium]
MALVRDKDRSDTRKRAINLSVSGDLIEQARLQGINLSRFLEEHLRGVLRAGREQAWQEENREAIRQYNETVAERGSFGDRLRRF